MPDFPSFRWGTRSVGADFSRVVELHPRHLVRRAWRWAGIQPAKGGPYKWASADAAVRNATAAGCPVMGVLSRTPAWASGGKAEGNHYPAGHVAEYAAFCGAAAARYPGVLLWEVFNEPDVEHWTPAQVKEVLVAASRAIKAANPAAKVGGIVSGCSPTKHTFRPLAWYDALVSDPEVRAAMDAYSFHMYECPQPPEIGSVYTPPQAGVHTQLDETIPWLRARGFDKEIWVTEGGWPTENGGNSQTSEADQARWIVRKAVITCSYPQVTRFCQFQLYGAVTQSREGGLGLITADGSCKPAFTAWKTMCGILDQDLTAITLLDRGPLWRARFDKTGGRHGWVLWTVSGTAAYALDGLGRNVRRTMLLGRRDEPRTSDGRFAGTARTDPVYIEAVW